jgi:hypothetical protein
MAVKTRYSKRHLPKRPRLKKRPTEESRNAFWQEYAQKFQDANNSVTSGRSTLPIPIAGANEESGRSLQDVWGNANGMGRRDRLVFRKSSSDDNADEYNARERAAVEEARRKAKQIAPLYNKGAYQLITEGDREALFNDGRGKK